MMEANDGRVQVDNVKKVMLMVIATSNRCVQCQRDGDGSEGEGYREGTCGIDEKEGLKLDAFQQRVMKIVCYKKNTVV